MLEANHPQILSVDDFNNIVESSLVKNPQLQNIAVSGEISELRIQGDSGHIYFTLRDSGRDGDKESGSSLKSGSNFNSVTSQVSCTFFAYSAKSLTFVPKAGDVVVVYGSVNVYKPQGKYSFNVKRMEKAGLGELFIKIAALRQKLFDEGLSSHQRKRALPLLPKRIGVVTGVNTAAFRDILKQAKDRFGNVNLLAASAIVQGDKAAESIVNALQEISKPQYGCEVVIIGRGGGSQEDLLPFSEEIVARAIAACPIPVISAVGHQIDHPVCDDVADVVAATPTDAAKIVIPDVRQYYSILSEYGSKLDSLLYKDLDLFRQKLKTISQNRIFKDPANLLQNRYLRLDEIMQEIGQSLQEKIQTAKDSLQKISNIDHNIEKKIYRHRSQFQLAAAKVDAYAPLSTLKRGYSIVYKEKTIIHSSAQLKPKDSLEIQFAEGRIKAVVS